jgi:hypothetical protein
MQEVSIFCEVPYLYRTKAELGWGGVNYAKLVDFVKSNTGCNDVGNSIAAVRKGPRQSGFLTALESFGFDIALGVNLDKAGDILPCWDQMCFESALSLLRRGPKWLAYFGELSQTLLSVSDFAISNWDTQILYAAFDQEDLDLFNEDMSELESNVKTVLIDASICNGSY